MNTANGPTHARVRAASGWVAGEGAVVAVASVSASVSVCCWDTGVCPDGPNVERRATQRQERGRHLAARAPLSYRRPSDADQAQSARGIVLLVSSAMPAPN